jgi:hypothetical protein
MKTLEFIDCLKFVQARPLPGIKSNHSAALLIFEYAKSYHAQFEGLCEWKEIPKSPIIHSDCNCELLEWYKKVKNIPF